MINPGEMMEFFKEKNRFERVHPKFAAFIGQVISGKVVEEGAVIEITVTKKDGKVISGNMRVQESDMELLQRLKEMK